MNEWVKGQVDKLQAYGSLVISYPFVTIIPSSSK